MTITYTDKNKTVTDATGTTNKFSLGKRYAPTGYSSDANSKDYPVSFQDSDSQDSAPTIASNEKSISFTSEKTQFSPLQNMSTSNEKFIGGGIAAEKYTESDGKSDALDAAKLVTAEALTASAGAISGSEVEDIISLVPGAKTPSSIGNDDSDDTNNMSTALLPLESKKSEYTKLINASMKDLTPYASIKSMGLRLQRGAIPATYTKSAIANEIINLSGGSAVVEIATRTGEWDDTLAETAEQLISTKDTILSSKPGTEIKFKDDKENLINAGKSVITDDGRFTFQQIDKAKAAIAEASYPKNKFFSTLNVSKQSDLKTLDSDGNINNSIRYINPSSSKIGSEIAPFTRRTEDLYNIIALRNKNNFIKSLGYIYVEPYYNNNSFEIFTIPFEFNPTIDEGDTAANYAVQTMINRIGEIRSYTGTNPGTVSIESTYYALCPDDIDASADSTQVGKQFGTDSWQYYWSVSRIQEIETKYRSLVMPQVSNTNGIIKPPMVEIVLGHDENASIIGDLFAYPQKEYGYYYGEDSPKAFDTDTYLNTTATIDSVTNARAPNIRLKKYIVTSVKISPIENDPYTYSSFYVENPDYKITSGGKYPKNKILNRLYGSDSIGSNLDVSYDDYGKTIDDKFQYSSSSDINNSNGKVSNNVYIRKGFKVNITLAESTRNFSDIVPDYNCYYKAWKSTSKAAYLANSSINANKGVTLFSNVSLGTADSRTANAAYLAGLLESAQNSLEESESKLASLQQILNEKQTNYDDIYEKNSNIIQEYKDSYSQIKNCHEYLKAYALYDNIYLLYKNNYDVYNSDMITPISSALGRIVVIENKLSAIDQAEDGTDSSKNKQRKILYKEARTIADTIVSVSITVYSITVHSNPETNSSSTVKIKAYDGTAMEGQADCGEISSYADVEKVYGYVNDALTKRKAERKAESDGVSKYKDLRSQYSSLFKKELKSGKCAAYISDSEISIDYDASAIEYTNESSNQFNNIKVLENVNSYDMSQKITSSTWDEKIAYNGWLGTYDAGVKSAFGNIGEAGSELDAAQAAFASAQSDASTKSSIVDSASSLSNA